MGYYELNPLEHLLEEDAGELYPDTQTPAGELAALTEVLANLDQIEEAKAKKLEEIVALVGRLEDAVRDFQEESRKTWREWSRLQNGPNHHIFMVVDMDTAVEDTVVTKAVDAIEACLDRYGDDLSGALPYDYYGSKSDGMVGMNKRAVDTVRKIWF